MSVLDKNVESMGELAIRVVAMPADTNPSGDIFGGWLLSQMDLAGSVITKKIAKSKVVTIAINDMVFKSPLFVGDTLCCYVDVVKVGRTSITVNIESWVNRELGEGKRFKVTEGVFTYVKVDENNKPSVI